VKKIDFVPPRSNIEAYNNPGRDVLLSRRRVIPIIIVKSRRNIARPRKKRYPVPLCCGIGL
jgi:hypothetical protein